MVALANRKPGEIFPAARAARRRDLEKSPAQRRQAQAVMHPPQRTPSARVRGTVVASNARTRKPGPTAPRQTPFAKQRHAQTVQPVRRLAKPLQQRNIRQLRQTPPCGRALPSRAASARTPDAAEEPEAPPPQTCPYAAPSMRRWNAPTLPSPPAEKTEAPPTPRPSHAPGTKHPETIDKNKHKQVSAYGAEAGAYRGTANVRIGNAPI